MMNHDDQRLFVDELSAQEGSWKRYVEFTPVPHAIISLSDGRFLYANPAVSRILGVERARIIGRPVSDFLSAPTEERDRYVEALADQPSGELEVCVRGTDGNQIWAIVSWVSTTVEGEAAILATGVDLTMSKHLEDELKKSEDRSLLQKQHTNGGFPDGESNDLLARTTLGRALAGKRESLERIVAERTSELLRTLHLVEDANLQLQEANSVKNRFLSSMSHELRTPLHAILGFTDLLAGEHYGSLNRKQQRYVQQIDQSGRHLLSLINDLLDVAKIDIGTMELGLERIDLKDSVSGTMALLNPQVVRKNLSFVLECDPNLPAITADRKKIKHILFCIIDNAIKVSHEGSEIVIHIGRAGYDYVRVDIHDSGDTIDSDEKETLFSESHQSDRVQNGQLGGRGVGLALTQRLIEIHGGRIGVESRPEGGNTFWFTLPAMATINSQVEAAKTRRSAPMNLQGRKILVVEDNELNLSMLCDMLATLHHQVIEARNGQEAVQLAQSSLPDMILMDIRMPVMNGLEATRLIRDLPGFDSIPIIALSASTGTEAEQLQREAGCTATLPKPFTYRSLIGTLEKYLLN
jgi:PAS domain S-box-containing protein